MKKTAGILLLFGIVYTMHASTQETVTKQEKAIRMSLVMTAHSCLGIGYQFNGTTPAGFDNAGFTQYVYYKNNIELPRKVQQQYKAGRSVKPGQARPGDLIFFYADEDTRLHIGHVGLYLGKNKFIHMPGEGQRVRIDRIKKGGLYAKRFAGVRSYRDIFTVPAEPNTEESNVEESNVEEITRNGEVEEDTRMFDVEDY